MTTSQELEEARFAMSAPGLGYDTRGVDAFLESSMVTLGHYECGVPRAAHPDPVITADEARAIAFEISVTDQGYDPAAVDELIRAVAATLDEYEQAWPDAAPSERASEAPGLSGRELMDAVAYARAVRPGGLDPRFDNVRVVTPAGEIFVIAAIERSNDGIVVTLR